jgi:hypothetical protein
MRRHWISFNLAFLEPHKTMKVYNVVGHGTPATSEASFNIGVLGYQKYAAGIQISFKVRNGCLMICAH